MNNLKRAWLFISQPDEKQRAMMNESRPFLLFLTLVLTGMMGIVISSTPSLQSPGKLTILVGLFTLHILLHWYSSWSSLNQNLTIAYLVAQGVLVVTIIVFSGQPQLGIGLFAALFGEILGIWGLTRISVAGIVVYLILQPVAFYWSGGMETVRAYAPFAFVINVMLIVIMTLLKRSMDSGDQAKALLVELEQSHEKLADYAAQVESLTIAEERTRMARDLHDTLVQGLAGLVMQLEAVQHHLSADNKDRAGDIIENAMERARTTLSGAREAIEDLRNHSDVEFLPLIQQRMRRFSHATGVRCDLSYRLPEHFQVDSEIRDHAELILGEALANIAVHAKASSVKIQFLESDIGFRMDIIDDGVGFVDDNVRRPGHYGLIGMRERARLAGGQLEVETSKNNGCRITAVLPLSLPVEWREA